MRAHAILLVSCLLLAAACSDGDHCDGAACKATEAKYGLSGRSIHSALEKTFVADDGLSYTLLRYEYGDTQECDELDDSDCSYSTYCAFVLDGVDYPLDANFITDEDALFDLDEYCSELACDMPAYDLAIFDDEAFDEWLTEADDADDLLATCF